MDTNVEAFLKAIGTVIAIVGGMGLCLYLIVTNPLLLLVILIGALVVCLTVVFFYRYKLDIERKNKYKNIRPK